MKNNSNIFKWIGHSPEFSTQDRWALGSFLVLVVAWYAYELMPVAYLVLPKLFVNQFSMILVAVSFFFAFALFLQSNFNRRWANRLIWPYWVISLPIIVIGVIKGLLYNHFGNTYWLEVFAQAAFCISLFYVIIMGKHGMLLEKLLPFFLVMFYLAAVIMWVCKGNVMTSDLYDFEAKEDTTRHITSMAYLFKQTMDCAPFFFFAGCLWRKKLGIITRILCLATVAPYAFFIVYMFKFRGGIVILAVMVAMTLLSLFLQARIFKFLALAAIVGIGGLYFAGQSSFLDVRERMIEANEKGGRNRELAEVFENERAQEVLALFDQLSTSELLFGRGYNATYDATDVFGERGSYWRTTHIGFVSNVLRNGVIFSALYFLVFLLAWGKRIGQQDSQQGLSSVCRCFVIVGTIQFLSNPLVAQVYHVGSVLILYLCLGFLWTQRDPPPMGAMGSYGRWQ